MSHAIYAWVCIKCTLLWHYCGFLPSSTITGPLSHRERNVQVVNAIFKQAQEKGWVIQNLGYSNCNEHMLKIGPRLGSMQLNMCLRMSLLIALFNALTIKLRSRGHYKMWEVQLLYIILTSEWRRGRGQYGSGCVAGGHWERGDVSRW